MTKNREGCRKYKSSLSVCAKCSTKSKYIESGNKHVWEKYIKN